jgi:hypothetical protein
LGQQDEPFVVSQAALVVVSVHPELLSGQHDEPAGGSAGLCVSFTATMPRAASRMTPKMIFVMGFFFFGGQQSPSHPQSFVFSAPWGAAGLIPVSIVRERVLFRNGVVYDANIRHFIIDFGVPVLFNENFVSQNLRIPVRERM